MPMQFWPAEEYAAHEDAGDAVEIAVGEVV
jgi:hypothetical protein